MMSFRRLNNAIQLDTVEVSVGQDNCITVTGQHGSMCHTMPESICIKEIKDKVLILDKAREIVYDDRKFIGTFISLLNSAIIGVRDLHEVKVVFSGTGVSVQLKDAMLEMRLGKSHKVYKDIPEGVTCAVLSSDVKEAILSVKGINKALVTKFASELRVKKSYRGGIHVYISGKKPRLKERKGA